jgi:hypothetical protein
MPETCLKRRMLFACEQSYDPDLPVAGRAVDWQGDVARISREDPELEQAIDFALVGRIPEGVLGRAARHRPAFYCRQI